MKRLITSQRRLIAGAFRSRVNLNLKSQHQIFGFAEDNTTSGIDKDFQPKVKKELTEENVISEIDKWVKENKVIVFIKGSKEMPKCGFSNYMIQILKFYKITDFKGVNVLESDIIRKGVKDYSNWPTFPQLYVNGELIGGVDIVKEMHENGSFQELCERNKLI